MCLTNSGVLELFRGLRHVAEKLGFCQRHVGPALVPATLVVRFAVNSESRTFSGRDQLLST